MNHLSKLCSEFYIDSSKKKPTYYVLLQSQSMSIIASASSTKERLFTHRRKSGLLNLLGERPMTVRVEKLNEGIKKDNANL